MPLSSAKIGQFVNCDIAITAVVLFAMTLLPVVECMAQEFSIKQQTDSLWVLSLNDNQGKTTSTWPLPYPVYRFCIADINDDGSDDAIVGVVKGSRFFPQPSRRVYIFKNYHGLIRPLWFGSRLRGDLIDFSTIGHKIRAIENNPEGGFYVSDYVWYGFGMDFDELIDTKDSIEECYMLLPNPSNNP